MTPDLCAFIGKALISLLPWKRWLVQEKTLETLQLLSVWMEIKNDRCLSIKVVDFLAHNNESKFIWNQRILKFALSQCGMRKILERSLLIWSISNLILNAMRTFSILASILLLFYYLGTTSIYEGQSQMIPSPSTLIWKPGQPNVVCSTPLSIMLYCIGRETYSHSLFVFENSGVGQQDLSSQCTKFFNLPTYQSKLVSLILAELINL